MSDMNEISATKPVGAAEGSRWSDPGANTGGERGQPGQGDETENSGENLGGNLGMN